MWSESSSIAVGSKTSKDQRAGLDAIRRQSRLDTIMSNVVKSGLRFLLIIPETRDKGHWIFDFGESPANLRYAWAPKTSSFSDCRALEKRISQSVLACAHCKPGIASIS